MAPTAPKPETAAPQDPPDPYEQDETAQHAGDDADAATQPDATPTDPGPEAKPNPAPPAEKPARAKRTAKAEEPTPERVEVYKATRPDGTPVTVTRNIDTGDQTVTED